MVTIKTYINKKDNGGEFWVCLMLLTLCILLLLISRFHIFENNKEKQIEQIRSLISSASQQEIIKKMPVNSLELAEQFTMMINKFYKNRSLAIKRDETKKTSFELTLNSNFFYNFIDDFQKEVQYRQDDNSIYLGSINQMINYDLYSQGKSGNLNLLYSITNLSQESQQYLLLACKIVTESSLRSKVLDSLNNTSNLKLLKLYAEELSVKLFTKWMNDFYSYLGDVRELRTEFGIEVYNVPDLLNVAPIIRGYDKEQVIEFIYFIKDKL